MATETALAGYEMPAVTADARPVVHRIDLNDLREALRLGWDDLGSHRSDVMTLCVLYPVLGLALSRAAYGTNFIPLLFPLAAGFALVGPFAAVGLYQMSRDREHGLPVSWRNAFGVLRRPGFGAMILLGLLLGAILALWLRAAEAIYVLCMGRAYPASQLGSFLHDVFATGGGWTMIVLGNAVGLLFALLAGCVAVVAAPMLIDDDAPGRGAGERLNRAVTTSLRAVAANPKTMVVWGVIVAALLLAGTVPLFLGLVVVLPLLGHATWHLYRRVVTIA